MSDRASSNGSNKSSDKTKTQTKAKRKRCPKGTRRNKDGDCVPLSVFQAEQKTQKKRCPKGTRRNEDGDCVPSSGAVSTAATKLRIPKPVLLGNSELVQFSFNDAQLTTFQPMVSDSPTSTLSWLNAVYALRLINTKQMEKEAAENGNSTMSSEYAKYNMQDMFSKQFFNRNHIVKHGNDDEYLLRDIKAYDNTIKDHIFHQKIEDILKERLHDNHATIIALFCVDRTHFPAQNTWYHYLIAYKVKWTDEQGDHEEVELYDPLNEHYVHEFSQLIGFGRVGSSIHHYLSRAELNMPKKEVYYITYFTFSSYDMPKQDIPLKPRIPSFMYHSTSPRTAYATTHFSAPIKVLGHHSLFQVSFTPEQFEQYKSINYYEYGKRFRGGSCVIHALFSLGLRNVTEAKKDVQIMDYRSKKQKGEGVYRRMNANYFENIMKLPKGSIKVWINKCVGTTVEDELKRAMNLLLENNHATTFALEYYKNDEKKTSAHALVAYKRDGIVEYFDPQTFKRTKNNKSIVSVMKSYGNLDLHNFTTFHFANYKTQDDILIDDASCRLKLDDSRSPDDSPYRKYDISFDEDKDYPTSY